MIIYNIFPNVATLFPPCQTMICLYLPTRLQHQWRACFIQNITYIIHKIFIHFCCGCCIIRWYIHYPNIWYCTCTLYITQNTNEIPVMDEMHYSALSLSLSLSLSHYIYISIRQIQWGGRKSKLLPVIHPSLWFGQSCLHVYSEGSSETWSTAIQISVLQT